MDDYNNTLCVCGSPRHRHTHDTVGRGPCLDGNGCTEFRLPRGAIEPQRIEDLTTPPVVGTVYLVPCVLAYCSDGPTCRNHKAAWMPITGPMHSDAEYIGFEPMHYHFDHRFTPHERFAMVNSGSLLSPPSEAQLSVMTQVDKDQGVQHRPMECLRDMPAYPKIGFIKKLSEAYADKYVTTCGKCPHRGLPLSSLPREPVTSVVTCPGHGLKWDMDTGKLVRP